MPAHRSRRIRPIVLAAVIVRPLLCAACTGAAAQTENTELEKSRAIASDFGARLQGALMTAMEEGGPVAAVRVCTDVAPNIASELSRQFDAKVERTSLRVRNAVNAPEPWQVMALKTFDERARSAETHAAIEHFERADGTHPARYMKAIRTAAVCLICHGSAVSDEVAAALDHAYPFDRARGHEPGDIRGAFSVTWPNLSGDRK